MTARKAVYTGQSVQIVIFSKINLPPGNFDAGWAPEYQPSSGRQAFGLHIIISERDRGRRKSENILTSKKI